MERFILVTQSLENGDGIVDARLLDHDGLETARERGILFEVLLVLIERRRADDLNLAARERGLQDVRGVERALGSTRADERMHLIDEEDDVTRTTNLVDDALEALLELAAVFRARDERGHREGHDALILQHIGHGALDDALREPLGDGGLADARLADEDGVVLRAPREDLDHALDLLFPSDDGIHLLLPRHVIEVPPVTVEQRRRVLPAAWRRALHVGVWVLRVEHVVDGRAQFLEVDAHRLDDARASARLVAQEAEQDMLRTDVVMAEPLRLAHAHLHRMLRERRVVRVVRRILLLLLEHVLHLLAHGGELEADGTECLGRDALLFMQEAEQDMLRTDIVLLELLRLILRELDGMDRAIRKSSLPHACCLPSPGCAASALRTVSARSLSSSPLDMFSVPARISSQLVRLPMRISG